MRTMTLKAAKAEFSDLVDQAIRGEFTTITRHGKPVAAVVSIEAAELAAREAARNRPSLLAYLRTFPGGGFDRNASASRDIEL